MVYCRSFKCSTFTFSCRIMPFIFFIYMYGHIHKCYDEDIFSLSYRFHDWNNLKAITNKIVSYYSIKYLHLMKSSTRPNSKFYSMMQPLYNNEKHTESNQNMIMFTVIYLLFLDLYMLLIRCHTFDRSHTCYACPVKNEKMIRFFSFRYNIFK